MATLPEPEVRFEKGGCPDCGIRSIALPLPRPDIPDDFDWRTRDYDSFRLFLMKELAHRQPERRRWTPADLEVVIVEVLAAALDRASHALDAVQAERFLESARRPDSVRRLLSLIGYEADEHVEPAVIEDGSPYIAGLDPPSSTGERIESYWRLDPKAMDRARAEGPRLIAEQRRMVTLGDHATALRAHPLVADARARSLSMNGWSTLMVAVIPNEGTEGQLALDENLRVGGNTANAIDEETYDALAAFHKRRGLPAVADREHLPTLRDLLRILVESWRMVGTEVLLEPAESAPVTFALSVRARRGYFRSELRHALAEAFSGRTGGFFEIGSRGFGEDLYASDLIERAVAVEGVEVACLNRFKRVGRGYPDRTAAGFIEIGPHEYAECRSDRARPERGRFSLQINGGERG